MHLSHRDVVRPLVALLALGLAVVLAMTAPNAAVAHELDHPYPGGSPVAAPLTSAVNSGGEGAEWESVATIPTGNPHTDVDFFTQGGETYAALGTLAAGGNAGGQSIIQLTSEGEIDPAFVTGHPSAACAFLDPLAALALQHDVEATPKSADVIHNSSYLPTAATGDAQLLVDATDAPGRCHDQGNGGLDFIGAPQGGLELVDITDIENPVEIGLTSHIGEAHTVNVDPKRPHIAYAVSSDSTSVTRDDKGTPDDESDDTFTRNNETSGLALDGFEVVDMSSCMLPPYGTLDVEGLEGAELVDAKREQCRPVTFRYRWPTVDFALGHTSESSIYGCHELEIYPDDRLTCGSGQALIVLDMAGAFDDMGTPENYLDDKPRGTPLPCFPRESSTTAPYGTGATVMDCVEGGEDGSQSLSVSEYPEGNESLTGVDWIGTVYHQGRSAGAYDVNEDIDFNHEAEFTQSGNYLIATDERGGGVSPPGAACDQADASGGNGGIHAYQVDELRKGRPVAATEEAEAEEAFEAYARGTDGEKAIFRAPVRTQPQASICTAHVMQQIPGQNRIFMGWYSQGTQVIDYVELPNGQLEWVEDQGAQEGSEATDEEPAQSPQAETSQAGYFIPEGSNTWVSHIFRADENEDGTFTYYGVAADFGTRNSIDIYKVTLPAPADVCTLAVDQEAYTDRDQAREVHQRSVNCVLHYEIAGGTSDTTYGPTLDVTRAQMASFVVNAINASGAGDKLPPATSADEFDDISNSDHRGNIERLAQAGIIVGTGEREFSPDRKITREQMATFMVAAARFVNDEEYAPSGAENFSDVGSSTHEGNINAGFEAGLFTGTTAPQGDQPGAFSPEITVKRDQMATFLIRLFIETIQ